VKFRLPLASFCVASLFCSFASSAWTQTYGVNGHANASANQGQGGDSGQSNLGWGSSIDVARQARAAQDALKRNDYAAALSSAERATKLAPKDAELWFLLGYAARLDGHLQASADAYSRGLQLEPHSVKGMAGLAQTFVRMGRDNEAQQLLNHVIDANPKDANSLQLAGELLLNSDPEKSLELLRRADTLQTSAHSDLLIAHAYQRLSQPDEATHYLNRAKARSPNDPEVLRAVAGEYREAGRYDQAVATLQSIPSKTPDIEAELAYTLQLAGKQQEAANLYILLARNAKGNSGLDLSAAQALIGLGQIDEARVFVDDARRADGNSYRLHAIQAELAEADNRFADASNEYDLALKNLPPNVPEGPLYPIELRLNLYELDLRQEDEAAGKQQLETALAQIGQVNVPTSSRPEMLRLRAAIEAGSGNLDAANKDLKEALALAPSNVNSLLNYANLQWKIGQKDGARDTFAKVLELDHNNRTALSSLGFLARDGGDNKLAEQYFKRAVTSHPKDFAPYLALGDLYTDERNFHSAETEYENAYQRMPTSALAVAGGANAALEAHNSELAQHWLDRSTGKMNDSPQVNREHERYLTLKGDYAESAKLGYAVLAKLPKDREGAVYLAYDLYYLGQFQDALTLATKYESIISDDKDLALVAGYVHAHNGESREALADFTRALERDPNMATGYVNRGFILNDLREPDKATRDFQTAIRLQSNYGEAHLGLAYADLQLHRPKPALVQLAVAQKILGKSHAFHLARAEAFRQEQDFLHAEAPASLSRGHRGSGRSGKVVPFQPRPLRPEGAGLCSPRQSRGNTAKRQTCRAIRR
jgi:tetratricopeptide (TPR) repeat protein